MFSWINIQKFILCQLISFYEDEENRPGDKYPLSDIRTRIRIINFSFKTYKIE